LGHPLKGKSLRAVAQVKFKDADLTRIPTLPLCYPLGYDVTLSIALHYLTGDFNDFFVYYFTVVK
jgi:hypothetical protein